MLSNFGEIEGNSVRFYHVFDVVESHFKLHGAGHGVAGFHLS